MPFAPFSLNRLDSSVVEPDEPLWVLQQTGRMYEAVLRFYGRSGGWEVRLVRNGRFLASYAFSTRAGAEEWATTERNYVAFFDPFWVDSHASRMI
jgi:hypothetical protein